MSTKTKTFTLEEIQQIYTLVKKYDSFNDDIKHLEESIQSLLKQRESVFVEITETRKTEEGDKIVQLLIEKKQSQVTIEEVSEEELLQIQKLKN